jgi:SAM-dependent methyltransferase
LLVSLDDVLPRRGRALDVAGGAGRHAVYLATRGLDVTLVDFSEVGLQRAEARAVKVGVPLQTVARDLETEGLPGGTWDLILCFHYLQRSLLGEFASALRLGGMVVLVHPTQSNLSRHARPSARHLLADGELERGINSRPCDTRRAGSTRGGTRHGSSRRRPRSGR